MVPFFAVKVKEQIAMSFEKRAEGFLSHFAEIALKNDQRGGFGTSN